MQLANTVPDQSAIIGYVTTGQFSLARGRGYALGAIRLTSILDLEQQSVRCVSFLHYRVARLTLLVLDCVQTDFPSQVSWWVCEIRMALCAELPILRR